jgi:hypothetical protein
LGDLPSRKGASLCRRRVTRPAACSRAGATPSLAGAVMPSAFSARDRRLRRDERSEHPCPRAPSRLRLCRQKCVFLRVGTARLGNRRRAHPEPLRDGESGRERAVFSRQARAILALLSVARTLQVQRPSLVLRVSRSQQFKLAWRQPLRGEAAKPHQLCRDLCRKASTPSALVDQELIEQAFGQYRVRPTKRESIRNAWVELTKTVRTQRCVELFGPRASDGR